MKKIINMFKKINSSTKSYKVLGARSLMEGFKLNGFSINRKNDPEAEIFYFGSGNDDESNRGIGEGFDDKGLIVVFPADFHGIKMTKIELIDLFKEKILTIRNIVTDTKTSNKEIEQNSEVYGISIGSFVKGSYTSKDGQLFDVSSIGVEVTGLIPDVSNRCVEEISTELKQEIVLIKKSQDNRIYLLN
jgi:hypothetical protein